MLLVVVINSAHEQAQITPSNLVSVNKILVYFLCAPWSSKWTLLKSSRILFLMSFVSETLLLNLRNNRDTGNTLWQFWICYIHQCSFCTFQSSSIIQSGLWPLLQTCSVMCCGILWIQDKIVTRKRKAVYYNVKMRFVRVNIFDVRKQYIRGLEL